MEFGTLTYLCALNRIFNYSCRKARVLLEKFPDPAELFSMKRNALEKILGEQSPFVGAILDPHTLEEAEQETEWAGKSNVQILSICDSTYPQKLKECCDAPLVLFYFGNGLLGNRRFVSVVGTRKATSYGISCCKEIIRELSRLKERPVIVSGLAYGTDITAHRCAIEEGLETVAVMATGLDRIYPPPHRRDAAQIAEHGGLLTDFQRGTIPNRINFLRRNRIIAGLSDAVILTESEIRGGGMVTAHLAFTYGREVFALPGRTDDRWSKGCNRLIEQNFAHIITSPSSIADEMQWETAVSENEKINAFLENCDEVKRNILVSLKDISALDRDSLIGKSGSSTGNALRALTELELDGLIESDLYGNYSLIR